MKKSMKRILCGMMSLTMMSTLVLESTLRSSADSELLSGTTSASASFKNVTGKYDTSALRESNFNSDVVKTTDQAPTYETRTVMVTLSGSPIADRAEGMDVAAYAKTWSGEMASASIKTEQAAFLKKLSDAGISYTLERTYDTLLNAVAIEVNTQHVSAMKNMAGVDSVVITTTYAEPKTYSSTSTSGVVTNETNVYATGIYDSSDYTSTAAGAVNYGEGTVVAVLDTGLDYTHPAFQGFQSEDVTVAWDEAYVADVLANNQLTAETKSGSLTSREVYVSEKVPFAYDYADNDPDVYPSYSNHGTHVAGIIGGYDTSGYTDKDGNPIAETFRGVVPDCQLVICKVFTDDLDDEDLGGAEAEDIIAALEDCVMLNVDVINMSLGTSCGFSTTDDGDDEGEMLNAVYNRIQTNGITLVCAASNDYSSAYGGVYGTNLSSNPDSSTVGSPSTFAASLAVASVNGQKASYMIANEQNGTGSYVFYEESRDINSNPFDFAGDLIAKFGNSNGVAELEYVVVPGVGQAADYSSSIRSLFKDSNGNSLNRIALIKRGDTTFQEKIEIAMEMGAVGVIVYNNVAGVIRMNLGEIENPVPSVSINMNAGETLASGAVNRVGKIKVHKEYLAGPFMSEFSSWGPTHDLKLKPEITAHGGEITSTVPGGYGEQSGTSMASPNMAGFMALVRSYIEKEHADLVTTNGKIDNVKLNRLAMQLTMSTATTVYDQDDLPYSPRKQGAGVARLERVIGGTTAYLSTDVAANDYRPKIELGDDDNRTGVYTLNFKLTNFGSSTLEFAPDYTFMTETLSRDGLTVSEQARLLRGTTAEWRVNGSIVGSSIYVAAGAEVSVSVTLTMSADDKNYIDESFENGMYVEGFLKLNSATAGQCDLSIPFLGFYGDWEEAPMLDYTAFEIADNEQDASVKEEDKIKASIWATQPYATYYNEKYIIPMGSYVYLLEDGADPVYTDEDRCAVSRYNVYYGDGVAENYLTTTAVKAVYAGLLRNARLVTYNMYNVETGELIHSGECNRVGKAYTGGGGGIPANVEVNLSPEEQALVDNGQYRLEFEFFMNTPADGEVAPEENTFAFNYTVDYDAPILEDARVRYYNYKDGNKVKQRIYLDLEVYDNHYAQALMLCYPKTDSTGQVILQLSTDFPTPVRAVSKNATTKVSVEITDIYEKYGNQFYVQIDDYALNSCLYQIDINKANANILPEANEFELGVGEENITLDIYETHKTALVFSESYADEGDASNFLWSSLNPGIANVKNGEIVGLSAGTTQIVVSNRKGSSRTINVTVTETVSSSLVNIPVISFGIIKNDTEALEKATGAVKVHAGQEFTLTLETDPWYHPMTGLTLEWSSTDPSVVSVDQNGNVKTLKKGMAIIKANVIQNGEPTMYSATVALSVQNEFTVSNYTLTDYNGVGGVVVIPTDLNVMYIGEDAFKDNNNITKIVIPASVIDILPGAFYNCTALEEVYFVSEDHRETVGANGETIINQNIDFAELKLIYEQAFYGCTKLRKIDFSNVKTVTVARECFAGCTSLSEVVDMPSIATMHHYAFMGCTSLTSVDLSGLHMSGDYVFAGCSNIASVTTGKFTALGRYMFADNQALSGVVTIHTPKIGEGAFQNCGNLAGVKFQSPANEALNFDIGAKAFENCGNNLRTKFTVDFNGENIRSIGDRAFARTNLQLNGSIKGLKSLGANAFDSTGLTTIYIDDNYNLDTLQLYGVPFKRLQVKVASGTTKYVEENGVIYNANKTKIYFVNAEAATDFTVASTVTEIGAYAFAASNVRKVTLHANVTKLGEGAFAESELREIDFANAELTEIPAKAFASTMISSITLPDSVQTLGANAFENSALTSFTAGGLTAIEDRAFASCIAMQKITLADGIKTMGDYVFTDCTSLQEVTLPSVEQLGMYTFYGCNSLETVVFGDNASTTGTYTFMQTSVRSVDLGETITAIEEGAFYNCRSLASITLPASVRTVADFAFNGCSRLSTVVGIENVRYFGAQAFYNSAITTLTLTNAKEIGTFAFAGQGNANFAMPYTSIAMPNVEKIGNFAFLNGSESSVVIPDTLKEIGYGAFAASSKLKTFTVSSANSNFFVNNNVLYRYIDRAAGEYELVCYPAALVAANEQKVYTILDGTIYVQAYAFYNLNENAVKHVVLPYSVNAIGDSAFYASGVTEYTFESVQAPVLETFYRDEIASAIESLSTTAYYKGYYYANFGDYVYNYTSYVGETSTMVMHYPDNGVGYDSHIYSLYFGSTTTTGITQADQTRECIRLIDSFDLDAINALKTAQVTDANKAIVEALSEDVKNARTYYNNASSNAEQASFITAEQGQKLLAVEAALRDVKAHFGMLISLSSLKLDPSCNYKKNYKEGETFDMSGLVIILEYEDYSTEKADASKLVLETGALTKYDRYVIVKYEDKEIWLDITVTAVAGDDSSSDETPDDSTSDSTETPDDSTTETPDSSVEEDGCGSQISALPFALALMLGGVAIIAKKKVRNEENK